MLNETQLLERAEQHHAEASRLLAEGRDDEAVDEHVSAIECEGDAISIAWEKERGI